MAYSALPTRTSLDINSASDVNQLQENIAYLKGLIDGKIIWNLINSKTCTSDYTILDDDGYRTIFADPSARALTITLPTLADNINRIIDIKVISLGGWVKLAGEGAETIDGIANFIMYCSGDYVTVIGEATGWRILCGNANYETGWVASNGEWRNRHLGTITVATKTVNANLYTVGELITEETSGNTWRIDSITAGDPGAFVVRAISGTGLFTANKRLAGATSGYTTANGAQVGTATLLQDGLVLHNFGVNMNAFTIQSFFNSAANYTEAYQVGMFNVPGNGCVTPYNTNSNSIRIQTSDSGYGTSLADNGTDGSIIDTENGYYNIRIIRKI